MMREEFDMAAQSSGIEVSFIIREPFKVSLDGGVVSVTGRMSLPTEVLYVLLIDECSMSGIEYVGTIAGSRRLGADLCQRVRNIISSVATKASPTELMGIFVGFLAYGLVEVEAQCCSQCSLYAPRSSDLAAHWLNSHPYEAMRMGLWVSAHAELDALAQAVGGGSQLAASVGENA
jgi:hypothetical protein